MKTLFSLSLLFLLLAENAHSQVLLLEYPNEQTQIAQKSSVVLDLSLLAKHPNLQLELWHKDEMVDFVVLPPGTLDYSWQLEKQRASKHYQIRLVSAIDARLLAQTERFEIGRANLVLGSRLAAIASSVALVGAGVFAWFRVGILESPDPIPVR
ncbi:MAG: hypothetical protein AAFN10_19175 [Bacteroidota bacterium]